MTVKKRNDIEYKKVKCFAMGFAAVHFDQFLANLVWLIRVGLMIVKFRFFVMNNLSTNAWRLTQPENWPFSDSLVLDYMGVQ